MNYIVFDLEWNQSAQGKAHEIKGFPCEIIEIGAVKLNEKLEITDRFECLIKPRVYVELQSTIREMLPYSEKELMDGEDFDAALIAFLEWCGSDYQFCTWGMMDIPELERNMQFYGYSKVFAAPLFYYDLQKLFSIRFEDRKLRRNLEYAIQYLKIANDEPFHRASNDAYYTARVMQKLDFELVKDFFSIDTYYIPEDKKHEIKVKYRDYAKYISMGYESKEDMLVDSEVTAMRCCHCGKNAERKIRWFAASQKSYYGLAKCRTHGFMKCRIRVKRDYAGKYYAVKVIKGIDEEGAEKIRVKLKDTLKRRQGRREE